MFGWEVADVLSQENPRPRSLNGAPSRVDERDSLAGSRQWPKFVGSGFRRQSSAIAGKSQPGKIHLRIIEVMKRFPTGISGGQIRQELEKEGLEPGDQTHLDRRKRDLKKWFVIEKDLATIVVGGKNRKVALYKYVDVRRRVVDRGQINLREKAEVIHGAHGRCRICGKSVEKHGSSREPGTVQL
jgi:hypothetical protein